MHPEKSGKFWYRIEFFIYTQMRQSEIKTSRFDQVFGGFEYEI